MTSSIISEIGLAWQWAEIRPVAFVMQNDFGNVIFKDEHGRFRRLMPEERTCEVIAEDDELFAQLEQSAEL